ncbi:MAG: 30S ribosomal protein S12 methylthiotransferase RimO, partial [Deltaproteobacteria bacterium]|nr:30S ribosomal protein S12 methylthiotransferase RimO [Deltaproteobacteria bacterium]
ENTRKTANSRRLPRREPGAALKATLHVVSLGCPKNRVDSEVMLGHLVGPGGFALVADPAAAEVILVNTCAFLQQAVEESIDTILELARHKEEGCCRRLLVTGCLVQSHGEELAAELPEVDAFLGLGELPQVLQAARGEGERLRRSGRVFLYDSLTPRQSSLPGRAAYVKVAEGCNRSCSFCRIPAIRGPQQSRPVADVVEEATRLAEQGIVELNLVAQDLGAYGRERGGPGATLAGLLERLATVRGIRWIRLLYLYPQGLGERLIELLAAGGKLLPYIDLPLQHVADPILQAMRRGHGKDDLLRLVDQLRRRIPGAVLRTTFIVGFPGESEAQFAELLSFVVTRAPERVAVFRYSAEPGTAASLLPDTVPAKVAARRYRRLSAAARRIALAHNRALVGRTMEVLVEGPSAESELLWEGRTSEQGPEGIDGVTYLPAGVAAPGTLLPVRITEAHPCDLVGEPAALAPSG